MGHDRATRALLRQARRQQRSGAWLAAAASYAELAIRHPHDHRLLANQGNALWLADLPEAAELTYRRALALVPDCPISRRGLASCLRDLNRFEEAQQLHRQLEPLLAQASAAGQANLWAHSQVLIGLERYGEAFARMAWRRRWAGQGQHVVGDPLAERLQLESEQGFGDSLQFVRFLVPLIRRRQAAGLRAGVCLQVEPALVELFREGLAWLDPQLQVEPASAQRPKSPTLSLLELPGVLGVQQLPPWQAYLQSPHWPQATLRGRPLRVGLVSASGQPGADPFCRREFEKRTLPMPILWRLVHELRQRGAQLHDLQYGADARRHRAVGLEPPPAGQQLEGFAATARLVAQLDLVISVDTAMAHLLGAMGRSCWVLLPWSADPRWSRGCPVSPWYPQLQLFRQPRPGDWHGAVDLLLDAIVPIRFAAGPAP